MYKNLRPTLWCLYDETALAEAEIEYKDRTSAQIYVHFPATQAQKEDVLMRFGASDVETPERLSVVCWTTTPWSLPGVFGVAFNAEAEYGLYRVRREGVSQLIVVATALAADVFARPGGAEWETSRRCPARHCWADICAIRSCPSTSNSSSPTTSSWTPAVVR